MKNLIVILALVLMIAYGCVTDKQPIVVYHPDGTATVTTPDGNTVTTEDPSSYMKPDSVIVMDVDVPNVMKVGQKAYFDGYFLTNYNSAVLMGGDPIKEYKKLKKGDPATETGYLFAEKLLVILPDGSIKIK